MVSKEKVEIIQQAIKQLIEEEKANDPPPSSSFPANSLTEDDQNSGQHQLLSKLLSQLESLEGDESNKEKQSSQNDEKLNNHEKIMKELKNVKRQNNITHCLLSAMIVLTLVWQLSEVSLILKIKNGFTNPFKSVGGIIGGLLKNRHSCPEIDVQEAMNQVTTKHKQVTGSTAFPGIKVPELPHLDLPGLDFDTSEDD
ncbi:hypothetical protein ACJIZ3_010446 [Penstemon smallii]|uniref:Transmembrane protein n=1 Tax=Penstemon smallii TaxID=265156 RepID=A0ABD3TGA0_9LAMI